MFVTNKNQKHSIKLFTIAYDDTCTWIKGAKYGPEAFKEACENLELYDIETKYEVYKKGILIKEIKINNKEDPKKVIQKIYSTIKMNIKKNKFITLIGGNHSISIGSIKAFGEKFHNITILQLDAHADLRKEYRGTKFNHACALHEAYKKYSLIQVGIRSLCKKELKYINKKKIFYAKDIYNNTKWIEKILKLINGPLYITIDIDVFDPSIAPSTGTPEPGGLLWYETLFFLKKIFQKKQVVGFDIVELSPNKYNKSTNFLVAKLYYKILSYKFYRNSK